MSEIYIAGRPLSGTRHICAFFHNKEEEYRTLVDFIREGLEKKEGALHMIDGRHQSAHRARLKQGGIDVEQAEEVGLLKIAPFEETYLKDGRFDWKRQIELVEKTLKEGRKNFPLMRLMGHMEWALQGGAGVEDLVEYECRLNYVLPKYEDPAICVYDLSQFNAGVVMDVLRTHPVVILGGILQENPLYVPPDEFLKELSERREALN